MWTALSFSACRTSSLPLHLLLDHLCPHQHPHLYPSPVLHLYKSTLQWTVLWILFLFLLPLNTQSLHWTDQYSSVDWRRSWQWFLKLGCRCWRGAVKEGRDDNCKTMITMLPGWVPGTYNCRILSWSYMNNLKALISQPPSHPFKCFSLQSFSMIAPWLVYTFSDY